MKPLHLGELAHIIKSKLSGAVTTFSDNHRLDLTITKYQVSPEFTGVVMVFEDPLDGQRYKLTLERDKEEADNVGE